MLLSEWCTINARVPDQLNDCGSPPDRVKLECDAVLVRLDRAGGGTTEPVMMTSPARSRSPNAASTSATWRTISTILPVLACGSLVRADLRAAAE